MKTKVSTWLPCFSGFYCTIWEPCEDQEIQYINEKRESKGLSALDFDAFQFDYKEYELRVVKGIANFLERELSNFVNSIEIEGIDSPKEYNFRNDSANVLIEPNEKAISEYLENHSEAFRDYIKDRYTSRSGFISFYPNDSEEFLSDNPLEDKHKLGSILEFICINEGIEEIDAYYKVEPYLSCSNYSELVAE